MWGPSWTSAGDDPGYKGASATMDGTDWSGLRTTTHKLAEDFLKELEKR